MVGRDNENSRTEQQQTLLQQASPCAGGRCQVTSVHTSLLPCTYQKMKVATDGFASAWPDLAEAAELPPTHVVV